MSSPSSPGPSAAAPGGLVRGIGLPQATALNVNNMIGIGPFITLPLVVADMGGPQALLCWMVGALIALCDGLVWAELSSRLPGSGGTYVYLREAYGPRWGRLMSFLFIWQVSFQGPLSAAGGSIGFSNYLAYLFPAIEGNAQKAAAIGIALLVTFMLYRRITIIGRIGVLLAAGALTALVLTIVSGFALFDPARLRDIPPDAFRTDTSAFWFGLGDATRRAIYAYLGYYNVCFLGDEVKDAAWTIPRSILLSVLVVAALYVSMNAAMLGAMPWQEVAATRYVAATVAERAFGPWAGRTVALLILWTAFASLFALVLANSRVLYAAARDGRYFSIFARVHPRDRFPHVALLALGGLAALFTLIPLPTVITSLIVLRALVQFIGQNVGMHLLRRNRADLPPFRMWLYPIPSIVAAAGWIFIFVTSRQFMLLGFGFLFAGVIAFLFHQRQRQEWPFASNP